MATRKKLELPKSVLDMKFMKKAKERKEREIENTQDHHGLYANIITTEMRHASGNYISESSFLFCQDLLEGRLSFKGMNPEIERLMEQEATRPVDGEMKKDIPDDIFAKKMDKFKKRRQNLMDTPSKQPVAKKKKL